MNPNGFTSILRMSQRKILVSKSDSSLNALAKGRNVMEYGCIGEKLKHSFSKEIHALLADYEYTIKEIPREELHSFLQKRCFKAINVTIPYKQEVIPYLDFVSEKAKEIGAVNTIVNKGGKLLGFNTDFYGLTSLINRAGITVENKKVLILGSGGTSLTANAVAKSLKAKSIYRVSRSGGEGLITYDEMYQKHTDAEIIINTTPVGMYPNINATPINISNFAKLEGVVDAIYNPLRTKLVSDAKRRGVKATGGLYMLVAQAAKAVEKFLDTEISLSTTENVYKKVRETKQNIVLIGMAGCGKTTIGKALSKELGLEFIDTDEEIVKRENTTITEIFKNKGEQYFRDIESKVIEEISAQSGKVIATGGGAILDPKNIDSLKLNGKLYFIDRPLKSLVATADRPLSSNRADLERRYFERYDKYIAAADVTIKATDRVDQNVKLILDDIRK